MKLYCWRARDYDSEAFVVAESEAEARAAIEATRLPRPSGPEIIKRLHETNSDVWYRWVNYRIQKQLIDDMLSGETHDLYVLEPGDVAWVERS